MVRGFYGGGGGGYGEDGESVLLALGVLSIVSSNQPNSGHLNFAFFL